MNGVATCNCSILLQTSKICWNCKLRTQQNWQLNIVELHFHPLRVEKCHPWSYDGCRPVWPPPKPALWSLHCHHWACLEWDDPTLSKPEALLTRFASFATKNVWEKYDKQTHKEIHKEKHKDFCPKLLRFKQLPCWDGSNHSKAYAMITREQFQLQFIFFINLWNWEYKHT